MKHSKKAFTAARGIRLSVAVVLLALLAGLLAVAQPARAGTYEVTITDNDGAGSLREAIRDAEAHPGADTITFAATTDRIPIVLSGPAGENDNVGGDLDILDNDDLTIQGNGDGNTIIDGNGNDRVFHVCPGGGCTNTVIFSGMTIQNGKVTLSGGGGIRNQGGTTIVDSSTIRGNMAVNGGGIANFATLTIQNSTIGGTGAGNQAPGGSGNGGGIYNYAGTLTVDHSVISANTAGKNGGGIWSQVTLIVQNGSIFSANEANWGGGIYNKATLNVQNGSIIGGADEGNKAVLGGGIYNRTGTTTVTGSTVSAGTANYGGGIYNYFGTLTVQNGSIIGGVGAGNWANFSGGGIYNENGDVTVDSSTISANTGDGGSGGGIINSGTLNVQNGSTIGEVGAPNTAGNDGGGIFNYGGTTTVDGSTVSANEADDGGGIFNKDTLIIQSGSNIGGTGAGNTATHWGGGILNVDGTMIVDDSSVCNNTANHGGGIFNDIGGTTTLIGSTVCANTATYGGGIYNFAALNVQDRSTIGGAGAGNIATTGYGGGIYNGTGGDAIVTGSRVLNNTAVNGGGVFNYRDTAGATSVTGSCIVDNSDTSFFNLRSTEQFATGNWWGAAGGPTAPGADTVSDNVNYSGYLNDPILDCAPDLYVLKTCSSCDPGRVGTPFHWILTVRNSGLTSATFDAGQTILVDELATGPTYGDPAAGSFVDVTNSGNIQCGLVENTITCKAVDGDVTLGASPGGFEVTFSVTPSETGILVNGADNCQVDPNGNVTENHESNNNCLLNVITVELNYLYLPAVMN